MLKMKSLNKIDKIFKTFNKDFEIIYLKDDKKGLIKRVEVYYLETRIFSVVYTNGMLYDQAVEDIKNRIKERYL